MSFPIANYLTVARIVMIPLVVILFYAPYPWANAAAAIGIHPAAVTDSLDGYLARASSARLRRSARSSIPSPTS